MIIFYSKSCESCAGNHALTNMKARCEKKGVDFEERRTILWKVYKEEADKIMELNDGLKLPFFYGTESGEVLEGYSGTPLETLDKLIKLEKLDEH